MTLLPLAAALLLLSPIHPQDPPTTPPAASAPALRPGTADDALAFLRALAPARQARIAFDLKMSVKVGEQTLTLGASGAIQLAPGHRMRSRVDFKPPMGMTAGQYELICDGKSVWVRDLKAKTWSKQSADSFDKGGDTLFLTGLFAGMADQVLSKIKLAELEKLVSDSLSDSERQELEDTMLKDQGELQVGEETIDGKLLKVYVLQPPGKAGMKVRLLTDAKTGRIDRMQVEGSDEKMGFSVTERILSLQTNTPAPGAFTFVPQGKQVPKISVGGA